MEHKILHALIKFLRGQSKFPKKLIKSYLKGKKLDKRAKKKLTRYKSGKFKTSSFNSKVLHAIEELNEFIESDYSCKKEQSDVLAQLKLLLM